MPVSVSDQLRTVAGRFATGVTVVSARTPDGVPCGLTVNSFTSVSLDPPLVLVCIADTARSHDQILEAGAFAVNVLRADGRPMAERFWKLDPERRFEGIECTSAETGAPILPDTIGRLDCRIEARHQSGDHSILIGRVVAAEAAGGEPLLFWSGNFHEGMG